MKQIIGIIIALIIVLFIIMEYIGLRMGNDTAIRILYIILFTKLIKDFYDAIK